MSQDWLTVLRLRVRARLNYTWLNAVCAAGCGKVASYYFRKGIVDSRRGTPYRFSFETREEIGNGYRER